MSHSVRQHLRLDIDDYDATIRRFIPDYETMLSVAAEAVDSIEPKLVVDLGAGTGALSEAVLDTSPEAVVELLDIDPEMLKNARARLERFGERARFTLRSFDDPLPECDAFTASLSLHHIPTIERKAELFSRAFSALRPGGVLVNADATMPAGEGEQKPLYRFWADHMVSCGIPQEKAWSHFDEWAAEDTYLPLEVELDALRSVGFEAERVWSAGPIGVVVARRP
jgi:SAM-dependent methyltransferase